MSDDRNDLTGDRARLDEGRVRYPDRPEARERPASQRRDGGSNLEGVDDNRPLIVAVLYLASFVTGITGLVGVVLAHMWQGDARGDWTASHFTYQIRTFWVAFLASIVAALLTIVFIGFLLFPLIAIWFGVRSVLSLMRASNKEPMPNPETLGF